MVVRLLPRVMVLFLFGAVAISFFDGFHTHSGTTRYTTIVALQAAWWVPLLFGASVGLGGPAFAIGYRTLGGAREPPPWSALAAAFVAFGALYFFSGFFHGANAWKLCVLSLGAATLWGVLDRTWQGAACALGAALAGPGVEVVLTHVGAFEHLQADFLGIPMWLPALYACAAPVLGHGSRRFLWPPATT